MIDGLRKEVYRSVSGDMMIASISSHQTHSASGYFSNVSRMAGNFPQTGCVVCVIRYDDRFTVMKS
jgi:hypothetical protein